MVRDGERGLYRALLAMMREMGGRTYASDEPAGVRSALDSSGITCDAYAVPAP